MRKMILLALLTASLAAPALAADYPVSGRWGVTTTSSKGAIDCSGKRVITFSGKQRRDSSGGVRLYTNLSVTPAGPSRYDIVDQFTNLQVSAGRVYYTLVVTDADHIALQMQSGGTLKLQRCQ